MRGEIRCRVTATALCAALALSACTSPTPPQVNARRQELSKFSPAPSIGALTLEGYKKNFARKIAARSQDMFIEPLPEMLKSIVVLDVTIDRSGNLARVAVRRSNGYTALENRAIANVRRAAPFDAPARSVRRADGSVNFLETFLFRDDGRFRILSLQS